MGRDKKEALDLSILDVLRNSVSFEAPELARPIVEAFMRARRGACKIHAKGVALCMHAEDEWRVYEEEVEVFGPEGEQGDSYSLSYTSELDWTRISEIEAGTSACASLLRELELPYGRNKTGPSPEENECVFFDGSSTLENETRTRAEILERELSLVEDLSPEEALAALKEALSDAVRADSTKSRNETFAKFNKWVMSNQDFVESATWLASVTGANEAPYWSKNAESPPPPPPPSSLFEAKLPSGIRMIEKGSLARSVWKNDAAWAVLSEEERNRLGEALAKSKVSPWIGDERKSLSRLTDIQDEKIRRKLVNMCDAAAKRWIDGAKGEEEHSLREREWLRVATAEPEFVHKKNRL